MIKKDVLIYGKNNLRLYRGVCVGNKQVKSKVMFLIKRKIYLKYKLNNEIAKSSMCTKSLPKQIDCLPLNIMTKLK